jgi:hypothetical protein
VRHASLGGLRSVLERAAHRCRGARTDPSKCTSCRREQLVVRRLEQALLELTEDGQLKEHSARNRLMAMAIIESFGSIPRQTEATAEARVEQKSELVPRPEAVGPRPVETRPVPPSPPAVKPMAGPPRSNRRMLPGIFKPKFRLPGTKAKDEVSAEPPAVTPGKAQASSEPEIEELQFVPLDAGPKPTTSQPKVVPPRPPAVKHQAGYRGETPPAEEAADSSRDDESANRYRPRWSR